MTELEDFKKGEHTDFTKIKFIDALQESTCRKSFIDGAVQNPSLGDNDIGSIIDVIIQNFSSINVKVIIDKLLINPSVTDKWFQILYYRGIHFNGLLMQEKLPDSVLDMMMKNSIKMNSFIDTISMTNNILKYPIKVIKKLAESNIRNIYDHARYYFSIEIHKLIREDLFSSSNEKHNLIYLFMKNPLYIENPEDVKAFGKQKEREPVKNSTPSSSGKTFLGQVKENLKDELPASLIRITAKQAVKFAQVPLIGACWRYKKQNFSEIIGSQYGKAVTGILLSEFLSSVNSTNEKANVAKELVAHELKVEAMATVGNEVIALMRNVLTPYVMLILQNLNSEGNEEEEEEEEKQSAQPSLTEGIKFNEISEQIKEAFAGIPEDEGL